MTVKTQKSTQNVFGMLVVLLPLVFIASVIILMIYMGMQISALFTPPEADAKTDILVMTLVPTPTVAGNNVLQPTNVAPTRALPTPIVTTPTALPPLPTATPALPYLVTGNNSVNVRVGPGMAYPKMGLLMPGTQAIVTGWSGSWWQIDYQGNQAFVFGDIVTTYNIQGVPEVTPPPLPEATPVPTATSIPEPATPEEIKETRWIDVDLSEQRLTAYENQVPVQSYLVSTGLPQTPTPIGQYRIWIKLKTDDMSGVGYYIEDVPWVMYFYRGYGLHGVTWHANFGHQMSHGCVNQPNDMAEWLFNFAEVGTLVNIHE